MKPSPAAHRSACILLSHPLILKSAWQRVKAWYASGEWAPPLELAIWDADPDAQLARLSNDLAATMSFRPAPFSLIPYPKKGGIVRHYTMPSVRDQVAFAAFAVALAPVLEMRMPNFSFGNRWFRKIYRKSADTELIQLELFPNEPTLQRRAFWKRRPASLFDRRFYQPYPRSFGLFRRVAHWSAAALLDVDATDTAATDTPKSKDDYPGETLPPFIHNNWWRPDSAISTKEDSEPTRHYEQGYYIRLDLQLAYPSVRLPFLQEALFTALSDNLEPDEDLGKFGIRFSKKALAEAVSGYPTDLAKRLLNTPVRLALAEKLIDLLANISYQPITSLAYGDDVLWLPPHTQQALPSGDNPGHKGIPTGLAISGLLMNVYLLGFDWSMARWLIAEQAQGRPAAFLRFADDMSILSPNLDDLLRGIDAFWLGLCSEVDKPRSRQATENFLSRPTGSLPTTNLQVNWSKIEPPSMARLVASYLEAHQWKKCEGCGEAIFAAIPANHHSLIDWYQLSKAKSGTEQKNESFESLVREVNVEAVSIHNLQPFMTYLVERLSAIGSDSLLHRFGPDVTNRLAQLHELVRFDLQDRQIRADTRLSFAANRLAASWIPEDNLSSDQEAIRQIRHSIQIAVSKAPWKFKLWRAVVRAASRRPPGRSTEDDEREATEWLCRMAATIRASFNDDIIDLYSQPGALSLEWAEPLSRSDCWLNGKRSRDLDVSRLSKIRREVLLSHLRSAFWRAVAVTLKDLHRIRSQHFVLPSTGELHPRTEWPSQHWSFRAMSEHELCRVINWLSKLDSWATCLYPCADANLKTMLATWWWETEALSLAGLATARRSDVLRGVSNIRPQQLLVPKPSASAYASQQTLSVIAHSCSLTAELLRVSPVGRTPTWAEFFLTYQDSEASNEINSHVRLLARPQHHNWDSLAASVSTLRALHLLSHLPDQLTNYVSASMQPLLEWCSGASSLAERIRRLTTYRFARGVFLSTLSDRNIDGRQASLYRLLWGHATEQSDESCATWALQPSIAPVVGLPVRIALAMLRDALDYELENVVSHSDSVPKAPSLSSVPSWLIDTKVIRLLSLGRLVQLGLRSFEPKHLAAGDLAEQLITVTPEGTHLEIAPHPVFFIPWATAESPDDLLHFRLWSHVLLFYTAVEGTERLLDSLFENGLGAEPFEERWDLRGRIPLPVKVWELLEALLRTCSPRVGVGTIPIDIANVAYDLRDVIALTLNSPSLSLHDFRWEKVEINLDLLKSFEVPQAILPFAYTGFHLSASNPKFQVDESTLVDKIAVRMGQVCAHPNWANVLKEFPTLNRRTRQDIMRQIWSTAYSATATERSIPSRPDLIILPEVTVPRSEIYNIQDLARSLNSAIFCGLYWKIINTVAKQQATKTEQEKVFTNEALLVVPLSLPNDSGRPLARHFYVEKPIPASTEFGLARALSNLNARVTFRVLPGRRWYRFVHPQWGDFTIAICSDLLDASPWASLRGQILHLFMCAYNKDVELYEALTWIRAYESYVNVVSVNHGSYGGSFAWTPKHRGRNELARLRGNNLLLTADIVLPVKSLLSAQRSGVEEAITRAASEWREEKEKPTEFKAPPPDYPSRTSSVIPPYSKPVTKE